MKTYTNPSPRCLFILLLICTPVVNAATEIIPGEVYQGGTSLVSTAAGVEFSVPQGWQAILPRGVDLMIMEPENGVARIIVSVLPAINESGLLQMMNDRQILDLGRQLVPADQAGKSENLYHQSYLYKGFNPHNLNAQAYAVLGDNRTAFLAISLEPVGESENLALTKKLVTSVAFKTPVTLLTQRENSQQIDWERRLRGRALKYKKTSEGMTSYRTLNLCSDHSFSHSDTGSYASSDANTNFRIRSRSDQTGRWRVNGDHLELFWSDGSRSSYTLSLRNIEGNNEWAMFVDDERWFNVENHACY